MSKGSTPRPTDQKQYQENYEKIFGKSSPLYKKVKEFNEAKEKK